MSASLNREHRRHCSKVLSAHPVGIYRPPLKRKRRSVLCGVRRMRTAKWEGKGWPAIYQELVYTSVVPGYLLPCPSSSSEASLLFFFSRVSHSALFASLITKPNCLCTENERGGWRRHEASRGWDDWVNGIKVGKGKGIVRVLVYSSGSWSRCW